MAERKILSVGHMEFPFGKAQVQRQLLLAKAIILEGFDVTVLCRYGIHNESDRIEKEGFYEGVHYVYCSGTSVRPQGCVRRNMLKFKGLLNEIRYYRKYSGNHQLAGVLVSTNRFYNILFYFLLGRIFNTITVVDNVEYWTSNKDIKGLKRADKYLYDKLYYRYTDKIICISDFLINKVRDPEKRAILKIPSITDFEKFRNSNNSQLVRESYFLFCGSKAYFEVIDFVIASFEILDQNNILLILVTEKTDSLKDRILNSSRKDQILVMTNIAYEDLVNLYTHSTALIIPMRNTDQDKARFPHKISEYCAASRPIITDRVGEISNYFNENNSYLCSGYDINEFAGAMEKILAEPDQAGRIAAKSYQTGLIHFNYRSYSSALINLFNN
jgi:glycosyltransferase involved in cell wall biosynthesis